MALVMCEECGRACGGLMTRSGMRVSLCRDCYTDRLAEARQAREQGPTCGSCGDVCDGTAGMRLRNGLPIPMCRPCLTRG